MLVLRASAGMYTHTDGAHGRVPVGQFKIGLIAQERHPHLTNAVVGDPRVGDQEWARREGMVAFAGYPLMIEDRLVGVLAVFARHPLTGGALRAMATIASGVALGVERKRAEEDLRESEERFRIMADSIPQLAWMARPDGLDLLVQSAMVRVHRHHPRADGRPGLAGGARRRRTARRAGEVQGRTGLGRAVGGHLPAPPARRRACAGTSRGALPVRDAQTGCVRWFGTNTDITEQRADRGGRCARPRRPPRPPAGPRARSWPT